MEALKEYLQEEGQYQWQTINEETAKKLGFESVKDLCTQSEGDKELEVNSFYGAVRYLPPARVRNVEVGRVAVVTYGPHYGKKCVITDVVDQARVVVMGVDGVLSNLKPQSFPIRRLHLTNARVKNLSQRGHRVKKVKALLNADLESVKEKLTHDRKLKQISKYNGRKQQTDFEKFKKWAEKVGL